MLKTVKTVGTFLAIGLSLCIVGWLLRSIAPPVAFLMWIFGIPIAILSIPIGLAVWLGESGEQDSAD